VRPRDASLGVWLRSGDVLLRLIKMLRGSLVFSTLMVGIGITDDAR